MSESLSVIDSLIRIAIAVGLAGLIGIDREFSGKSAGLRTNALVGGSAAVFAILSIEPFRGMSGADPSRVVSEVVSGVGFLGAGAIFALGGRPRGLTTAAALWSSAAIGVAVGLDRAELGIAIAVVSVALLALVDPLERWSAGGRRRTTRSLQVVARDTETVGRVRHQLAEGGISVRGFDLDALHDDVHARFVVSATVADLEDALQALNRDPGVVFASGEHGPDRAN